MESQKAKSVISKSNYDGISEKWDFYAILLSEIEIPIIDIKIKLRVLWVKWRICYFWLKVVFKINRWFYRGDFLKLQVIIFKYQGGCFLSVWRFLIQDHIFLDHDDFDDIDDAFYQY